MTNEEKKFILERHPIYLNPHCIILLQKFKSTDALADIWVHDYVDVISDVKTSARQFIEQIGDECSVRFLQELRKACADKIEEWNVEFNTNHPMDSLKDE